MKSSLPAIIYLHGFNSSPASEKAQQFISHCQQENRFRIEAPALSHDPEQAIAALEDLIAREDLDMRLLVGSSLGGYYATYLAEKHRCRAALVNPAVSPVKNLGAEFLGPQRNLYTGEEYEFTRDHADFLDTLDVDPLRFPQNYLLLVQTGDEVLDYRLALARYADSTRVVQEGGSHRFEQFPQVIPAILQFAEQGSLPEEARSALNKTL